jgi:diaminopimelate epimerase
MVMRFAKMHGAGNDFILMTADQVGGMELGPLARKVCHRRFGVGADGVMVAAPSDRADIRMIYYNSDGSEGEMCGNGIRCFSRFVRERGLVKQLPFVVETLAGLKTITMSGTGEHLRVRVGMGLPGLASAEVPATIEAKRVWSYPVTVLGVTYPLYAIRMGVPHCAVFGDRIDPARTVTAGPIIETLPIFPAGMNVNFVHVTGPNALYVDTWERGAGHTLACGTGVCASAWLANERGLVGREVTVTVPGGVLKVEITDTELYLEGPAQWACEGEFSEGLIR